LEKEEKMQHIETIIKSLRGFCAGIVIPVDTSTDGLRAENELMHDSFTTGRFEGVCAVLLCWAAAVCIGLLLSRLH